MNRRSLLKSLAGAALALVVRPKRAKVTLDTYDFPVDDPEALFGKPTVAEMNERDMEGVRMRFGDSEPVVVSPCGCGHCYPCIIVRQANELHRQRRVTRAYYEGRHWRRA